MEELDVIRSVFLTLICAEMVREQEAPSAQHQSARTLVEKKKKKNKEEDVYAQRSRELLLRQVPQDDNFQYDCRQDLRAETEWFR